MSKIVLASFYADTPVDSETVKSANESARRHNNEPPFPSGEGVLPAHWYLLADSESGAVSASRTVPDADRDDTTEARKGEQA